MRPAAAADFSSGAYTMPRKWLRERISDARHDGGFSIVCFFFGDARMGCTHCRYSVDPTAPPRLRQYPPMLPGETIADKMSGVQETAFRKLVEAIARIALKRQGVWLMRRFGRWPDALR